MGAYINKAELLKQLSVIQDRPVSTAMKIIKELSTIDLVRCGECKYMRKYALRSDEPTGIWCHRWSVPRLVTDDDFCSYGERRSDESDRKTLL